ncbi:hypothetical protein BSKO_04414 [Bryopsis sp. KO-2023]|nr:hypothetical protein BSKO_04414 [Bryopsis sp. KO-2023]
MLSSHPRSPHLTTGSVRSHNFVVAKPCGDPGARPFVERVFGTRVRSSSVPLPNSTRTSTRSASSLQHLASPTSIEPPSSVRRVASLIKVAAAVAAACLFAPPVAVAARNSGIVNDEVAIVSERQTSNSSQFASFSSSEKGPGFVRDFVAYRLQKMLTMKLGGKLLSLILVATPAIMFGGLMYRLAASASWKESMFKAYTLIGRVPGCNAVTEKTPLAMVVANVMFLAGLMTFAVALGMISNDISKAILEIRSGNSRVLESGHTVILNYNGQLDSILRQMAIAKKERGGVHDCVVLLADLKKKQLDELTSRAVGDLDMDVRARYGCTHDIADLQKVAADKAHTIIWLDPQDKDDYEATARRLAAIASLKSIGAGSIHKTHLVVQTPKSTDQLPNGLAGVDIAVKATDLDKTNLEVVEMHDAQNLQRLLAQCAMQPGLGKIISNVLHQSEGTCEFYLKQHKRLAGCKFSMARRYFNKFSIPCGVLDGETNKLELNPSEDLIIKGEDKVVVLAHNLSMNLAHRQMPGPAEWTQNIKRKRANGSTYHIVVLSFDRTCDMFLKNLGDFAESKNVEVTVVASEKLENLPKREGNCRVSFRKGNPASYQVLSDLKLKDVDSLVIDVDREDKNVADAQVVSTLLQIQNLMKESHRTKKEPLHLVAAVNHPTSQEVARRLVENPPKHPEGDKPCTMDIILPQELSSGVLTQVAASPKLNLVFKDLLNSEGVELHIRNAEAYNLVGRGAIPWMEVMDAARTGDSIAIGYMDKDGKVCVAPGAKSKRAFEEGDKLVVFSND